MFSNRDFKKMCSLVFIFSKSPILNIVSFYVLFFKYSVRKVDPWNQQNNGLSRWYLNRLIKKIKTISLAWTKDLKNCRQNKSVIHKRKNDHQHLCRIRVSFMHGRKEHHTCPYTPGSKFDIIDSLILFLLSQQAEQNRSKNHHRQSNGNKIKLIVPPPRPGPNNW